MLAAAPLTEADEILLRHGGRVNGAIVARTDRTITVETGPGQVTLPLSVVERIVESRSAIEVWQERSGALAASDTQGWAELARWAGGHDLETQARIAWQRVLDADPQHVEANTVLGRVLMDGTWRTPEDAYRAQGLVPFEERWVTPAEHDALLREQAADSAAAHGRREAELRAREAEARAREAEARADAAENASTETEAGVPIYGGIPAWGGYGWSGYGCSGHDCDRAGSHRRNDRDGRREDGGHRRGDRHDPAPRPRPRPTPTTTPSSIR